MDKKKFNELFKNLWKIRSKDCLQREEDFEVYDVGLGDNQYLKIEIDEDSYGAENITGLEIVEGKEKTVTVFE